MKTGTFLFAGALIGAVALGGGCKHSAPPPAAEVRQLVTFHFLPGRSAEASRRLAEEAVPLYQADRPLLRFRAYREAESSEPLDLIVVSSFHGMAGMDDSNRTLADLAQKAGTSIGAVYGRIAELAQSHRDEIAEVDPSLSWGDVDKARLVVLVSIRTVPGGLEGYQTLLREELLSWERKSGILSGSESGVYLLSDGYRILRAFGINHLEDWQRYRTELGSTAAWRKADLLTAEERTILLAPVPELAVR